MTEIGLGHVRFSEFELDLQSGELWNASGQRVLLPQQPFRMLVALIRAQGNIVTREELRRQLWPDDTFVDYEHSINGAVKRLREAIGDSASAPRFIETIPRIGYRFIAPATFADAATPGRGARETQFPATDRHAPRVGSPTATTTPKRRTGAILTAVVTALTVAVAALWISSTRFQSHSEASRTLVRLTSSSGLNIDPALSPDGSFLAYASDREGTTGLDIWIQPVAGGTARRLTSDQGDEMEPSFSPDGASIFYSRRETGGIYRIDTLGGTPRLVVAGSRARTPRISADGQWVVYWTGQPVWTTGVPTPPGATSTLAVVPADGGKPTELATNLASARYGVWSPDGQRILFLGEDRDGRLDWYVIPREGGEPRSTRAIDVLRSAGITGVPIPGGWLTSHDVLFATAGDGTSNIWRLPIAPESATVSGTPTRLTFGSAEERGPAADRSGRIAFANIIENVDVWRVPLDERSGVGVGPPERVTDDAAVDQMMSVTQDGTLMVFISARTKANEAWLRDLRTGRERRLTFNGAELARIQPDGSHVAIRRGGSPTTVEIVATDGGAATKLCDDCQVDDWSPDGSQLVVERGNPKALFVHDLASGRERALARHPEWNLYRARFSPDGRWVAFHTTNSATLRQIYVVPVGESAAVAVNRWIPVVTDFGIQPSWAVDGRAIYYFSLRDGSFCSWVQPIDPASATPRGEPRVVQHLHEPRLRAASGALAINDVRGHYLYVTLTETRGNIWTLRE
jgi:Tol biopolymer transport system component/DNA-binding winged helix-turn-helix (wHTH) protein